MSSDEVFVSKSDRAVDYTNLDASKEDRMAEESEATGKVSKDEVEGLKDTIGGGQILDDSEGYTRASNKNAKPMQQEEKIDAAIDNMAE